jgi:hypothetical protein
MVQMPAKSRHGPGREVRQLDLSLGEEGDGGCSTKRGQMQVQDLQIPFG